MTFLTRNSNGARPKLMLHNELRSSPQRLRCIEQPAFSVVVVVVLKKKSLCNRSVR